MTVNIFADLLTQWRVGMSGPTGLDYSAIPGVLKMRGVKKKHWGDIFDGLKVMEFAALKEFRAMS